MDIGGPAVVPFLEPHPSFACRAWSVLGPDNDNNPTAETLPSIWDCGTLAACATGSSHPSLCSAHFPEMPGGVVGSFVEDFGNSSG